jgi:hypothetical protein
VGCGGRKRGSLIIIVMTKMCMQIKGWGMGGKGC